MHRPEPRELGQRLARRPDPAVQPGQNAVPARGSPFPIDHRGLKVPDRIGRRRPVGEVADPAGAVGEQHRGLPLELPRSEDPVVAVRDEEHHRPERDAALAGDGGEARGVLDEETGVAVAAKIVLIVAQHRGPGALEVSAHVALPGRAARERGAAEEIVPGRVLRVAGPERLVDLLQVGEVLLHGLVSEGVAEESRMAAVPGDDRVEERLALGSGESLGPRHPVVANDAAHSRRPRQVETAQVVLEAPRIVLARGREVEPGPAHLGHAPDTGRLDRRAQPADRDERR